MQTRAASSPPGWCRHGCDPALHARTAAGRGAPAEGADPAALWDGVQGGRQAEGVAPAVAAVAQDDLPLVVPALAQLAVQRVDVVGHALWRRLVHAWGLRLDLWRLRQGMQGERTCARAAGLQTCACGPGVGPGSPAQGGWRAGHASRQQGARAGRALGGGGVACLGLTALMYSAGVRPAVPMREPRMVAASSGQMGAALPSLAGAGCPAACSLAFSWACRLLLVYSNPRRWAS